MCRSLKSFSHFIFILPAKKLQTCCCWLYYLITLKTWVTFTSGNLDIFLYYKKYQFKSRSLRAPNNALNITLACWDLPKIITINTKICRMFTQCKLIIRFPCDQPVSKGTEFPWASLCFHSENLQISCKVLSYDIQLLS